MSCAYSLLREGILLVTADVKGRRATCSGKIANSFTTVYLKLVESAHNSFWVMTTHIIRAILKQLKYPCGYILKMLCSCCSIQSGQRLAAGKNDGLIWGTLQHLYNAQYCLWHPHTHSACRSPAMYAMHASCKSIGVIRPSDVGYRDSAAAIAVSAPRKNSYVVKVTAAEGAALMMLGRAPLYNPLMPSRCHIIFRQAGRDLTASGPTRAPYVKDRCSPATCNVAISLLKSI